MLKKRQAQLQKSLQHGGTSATGRDAHAELARVEHDIDELGGLEAYQKMSAIGQGDDRGGGSEKVLLEFLGELGYPGSLPKHERWRCVSVRPAIWDVHTHTSIGSVLEVGALKPDNYAHCASWMDVTPIDLHSRHPAIMEQDFLGMDDDANRERSDLVSLSLVVNFVPDLKDRGTPHRPLVVG